MSNIRKDTSHYWINDDEVARQVHEAEGTRKMQERFNETQEALLAGWRQRYQQANPEEKKELELQLKLHRATLYDNSAKRIAEARKEAQLESRMGRYLQERRQPGETAEEFYSEVRRKAREQARMEASIRRDVGLPESKPEKSSEEKWKKIIEGMTDGIAKDVLHPRIVDYTEAQNTSQQERFGDTNYLREVGQTN